MKGLLLLKNQLVLTLLLGSFTPKRNICLKLFVFLFTVGAIHQKCLAVCHLPPGLLGHRASARSVKLQEHSCLGMRGYTLSLSLGVGGSCQYILPEPTFFDTSHTFLSQKISVKAVFSKERIH
ncbi:Hypothetical predicted protein [Podarcis lilfordi]|uniref:Uncharacterized protein n=1 Tax=Podarcis lilfordi TaxID=74358 RepID=A0AA35LDH4_9SAUR|nr:Hypothetical predicted protein [Podarcis lilfordi]